MQSEPAVPGDTAHCPLCGQANACALDTAQAGEPASTPACWCMQPGFNRQALQELPERQQGRACICPACARQ